MFAKCPKCDKNLNYLKIFTPDMKTADGSSWRGAVMACPSCNTAITATIDPIGIKSDIINSIVKKLGR